MLASWQGHFGHHWNIAIWKVVPHCSMRCVWQEEKARSFEGCEQSILDLNFFSIILYFIGS